MFPRYNYIRKLGSGTFGSVWKVSKNGKIMALKKIELQSEQMKEEALKEVQLLKEISDPCVKSLTCFYDYHIEGNTLFIEMEYIEGLTLKEFATTYKGIPLLYRHLLAIIKDIVPAIQYLHSKGIIHRDIKPENIMIGENNQPKLIDIGLACKTLYGGYEKGGCDLRGKAIECCKGSAGTPMFMAPEALLNNVSYFVSDIFSLGASIYFAATGKKIYYPEPKKFDQLLKIVRNVPIEKLNKPNIQLNTLVNKMLEYVVANRITGQEILDYINN